MKNIFITAIAVLLAAGGWYFVYAQQQETDDLRAEINQIYIMTAQAMIQRQMVPPQDGGVIILVGNKLLKYDNNLNLLREVEFNVDLEKTYKEIYRIFGYTPEFKDIPK